MSRSAWIVLALLLLALAGSFALLRALEPASIVAEAPPESAVAEPTPSTSTAAPLEHTADESARAVVRETPKTGADAATPDDSELADALWVEGRVVFPNDTPLDEDLWVVAKGRKFEKRPLHRVKVGADGRFRVAFAKKTKHGTLALDAHYLYLAEPATVATSEPPADLVLSPLVGGRVRGVGSVPLGRNDLLERARGARVQLMGRIEDTLVSSMEAPRSEKLDDALAFDLGGLDPALRYRLTVEPASMAPFTRDPLRVDAGKTTTLEFELREGARVSGVVVDDDGKPVSKAGIGLDYPMSSSWGKESAEDGTFALTGLAPGMLTLRFRKSGLREVRVSVGELVDGTVKSDLRVVLARGLALRGRVVWPDGKPAGGANLTVDAESDGRSFRGLDAGFRAGDDGTFEITGLDEGRYTLRASAKRAEPAADTSSEASAPQAKDETVAATGSGESALPAAAKAGTKKARGARGPTWTAELKGLAAGTDSVALVLGAGVVLRGRVVDDTGAAVKAFRIDALPSGDQPWDRDWSRRQSRSFDAADGSFELEGLGAGRWSVTADVQGLVSQEEKVEVGAAIAPIVLRVPRGGRLAGLVVDVAGAPAPGARVRRIVEDEMPFANLLGANKSGVDWVECDADGRFLFTNAPVGTVKLVASARGAAESLPIDALVTVGETREVRLVLRAGGTIRGVVLDADGRPEKDRTIFGTGDSNATTKIEATSDAQGRFVIEHVPPGAWTLQPEATQVEMARTADSKGRVDYSMLAMRMRKVVVEDGQTIEVQLGGVDRNAILVRGRVTRGAKPVTDLRVTAWLISGPKGEDAQRNASTRGKDDGTYELALSGPGKWSLNFRSDSGAAVSHIVDVPSGPSFPFDVAFAEGRVAGRVVDREGNGLARQRVNVSLTPGTPRDKGPAASGSVETGEDGRFVVEGLSPGTYEVRVGQHSSRSPDSRYGSARRGGVVVEESGRAPEVVLVLDLAGQVIGTVIGADGNPCADAEVRVVTAGVRGGDGYETAYARTGASGTFAVGGLTPGAYEVHANRGSEVSREPGRVEVRSSEKAEARLVLVVGGTLLVSAVDADGKRVGAWCAIVDERGASLAGAVRTEQVPDPAGGTPSVRYGPLPPGRYRISAKNKAGVEASAETSVSAGAEASVVLHYGGAPR